MKDAIKLAKCIALRGIWEKFEQVTTRDIAVGSIEYNESFMILQEVSCAMSNEEIYKDTLILSASGHVGWLGELSKEQYL